jgi:hypothetical protein
LFSISPNMLAEDFQKILNSQELMEDPIAYFRVITDANRPAIENAMGWLSKKHSPEEFSDVCKGFAEGLQYVREKFGTQPALIGITDEHKMFPYANANSLSVYISRDLLDAMMSNVSHRDHKYAPFALNPYDAAMMAGVEEAYHIYQIAKDPERANKLLMVQSATYASDSQRQHDAHPLEHEAMQVVRQAMVDKGLIDKYAPCMTNVLPEDVAWLPEDYLKKRVLATNNIRPFTRGIITISADGVVTKTTEPALHPSHAK